MEGTCEYVKKNEERCIASGKRDVDGRLMCSRHNIKQTLIHHPDRWGDGALKTIDKFLKIADYFYEKKAKVVLAASIFKEFIDFVKREAIKERRKHK